VYISIQARELILVTVDGINPVLILTNKIKIFLSRSKKKIINNGQDRLYSKLRFSLLKVTFKDANTGTWGRAESQNAPESSLIILQKIFVHCIAKKSDKVTLVTAVF
jgi:hypothetical protein